MANGRKNTIKKVTSPELASKIIENEEIIVEEVKEEKIEEIEAVEEVKVEKENPEIYHTVVKGDTLWALAEEHYGDRNLYPIIMKLNNRESDIIHPGDILRVK